MSVPLVSVIMPCFNAAGTLPAAIESILAQAMGDFELICIDDGSADATSEVISGYAQRDPRMHHHRIDHAGVIAAMNLGLSVSESTIIARMDADDTAHPDRLKEQYKYLLEHPETGVVGSLVRFGGSRSRSRGYALHVDWTNTLLTPEEIRLNRFVECPLPNPSIMFRKELIHRYGVYRDGPFPEDYEIILRWLDKRVVMGKVDRELLTWNDPPTRLSRTHPRYDVDAFYATKARYLARWLARHNPHHPQTVLIGAGRTARKRAALLKGHGVSFAAFVDIDPRKVGRMVHGRPVIHRTELPPPGECFCLSYVGSRGAREEIQSYLMARGYLPGRDFLLAA